MLELIEILARILGPPLARLAAAGLESLAISIEAMNAPVTTAGVVQEIVEGLARDHPTWSGAKKRRWAADAIAHYIVTHGGTANEAAINSLIEIAHQASMGKLGLTSAPPAS